MCGRFALEKIPKALLIAMGLTTPDLKPRYNIAPTQTAPVVFRERNDKPALEAMRWGLIPHWAKDISVGVRAINARAESVDTKPTFRDSFKRRRCLVPVSGFYEWKREPSGKGKIPYYFTNIEEEDGLILAGLWDIWKGGAGEVHSFTILTTAADSLMLPIHDRMPVVLSPDEWPAWLNPDSDIQAAKSILSTPSNVSMRYREADDFVNNPRNEGEHNSPGPKVM